MANPLEKIIDLIKQTGDNCVVLDADGNPAYVILSFEDYQKILAGKPNIAALTEEQLLDKVNADIAAWKASHDGEEVDNWPTVEPVAAEPKKEIKPAISEENWLNQAKISQDVEGADDKYYFEPVD